MADEDQKNPQPSLEVPSLAVPRLFGRKKGRTGHAEPAEAAEPADETPTTVVETSPEPTPEVETAPVVEAPTQVIEPVHETVPASASAPTPAPATPLFADEVTTPAPAPEPRRPARQPRPPRETPLVSGRLAAALTGLMVGLFMVGATAGALQGCEAVQGTSSCGRAGFPLLLAIFLVTVVAGSALLRVLRVPDPTSTSFLAVGLVAVIALLFFINVIDQWWMVIAIPVVSVATFLLSHWVTTTFIEPAER